MSMAGVQRAPSAASWPLAELLGGFAVLPFESGPRVADLALHSAQARPGCLFLACAGRRTHGLVHAAEPDADWGETELARLAGDLSLPVIPVPSLAKRAADIAARFFAQPSQRMEVFGITGTARKTWMTHYLAQALGAALPQPGLGWAVLNADDPASADLADTLAPTIELGGRLSAARTGEAGRAADSRDAVAREGSRSEGRGARSEERLALGAKHRSASAIRRTRRPEAARAETTLSPQCSALPRWSAC